MFLMRLSEMDPVQKIAKRDTTATSQTPKKKTKEPKTSQPRFDFYDILKETKVNIPDFMEEEPSSSKSPEQSPAEEYILQVASFKNADDAEQLKVELILLNLEAQIEKARIRNGETWHRVLVGPFLSRSQRETARATLVANRYEALVLKRTAE